MHSFLLYFLPSFSTQSVSKISFPHNKMQLYNHIMITSGRSRPSIVNSHFLASQSTNPHVSPSFKTRIISYTPYSSPIYLNGPNRTYPPFTSTSKHPPKFPLPTSSQLFSTRSEAGNFPTANPPPSSAFTWKALSSFLSTNYIAISLLAATALGWFFPTTGTLALQQFNLQTFSTIGIFIVSGILLQRGEAVAALRSPLALAYGIAAILFITPLFALPLLHFIPFQPQEIGLGLAVFCCVPTTLSTCVTLTNACKGNAAIALLLVVITNIVGVFSIPAMLSLLLGSGVGISAAFEPLVLFTNLVKTVLVPLLFGIALQICVPGMQEWRVKNRTFLSYVSTFFLCMVPWMQLSVASSSNLPLTPATLIVAALAGAILHVLFLIMNMATTSFLTFSTQKKQDIALRKAVILCTSEKTLPVAVAVLNQLSSVTGAGIGFAVVSCVLAHIVQIAIDSAMVGQWNARDDALRQVIA